ncbi:MAG: hypothetical protein K2J80_09795, partial [Oscillospiraceae bacterium]|nr:hypothetical protein [Oscillospiraceae bacterium]
MKRKIKFLSVLTAAALVFGSAASHMAFAESNSAAADDGEAEEQLFNIGCASVGGKLTVSPTRAAEGTIVTMSVEPDENKVLSKIGVANMDASVYYNIIKQPDGTYTFIMPACNVSVLAQCVTAYDVTLSTVGVGTAVVSA